MAEGNDRTKPTEARFALAENVKHLMATYQRGFAVGLNAPSLEKELKGGVSAKTIKRMLDPYSPVSPNLDNVDLVANFFGVPTWELLRRRPARPLSQDVEVTIPPKPSKPRR